MFFQSRGEAWRWLRPDWCLLVLEDDVRRAQSGLSKDILDVYGSRSSWVKYLRVNMIELEEDDQAPASLNSGVESRPIESTMETCFTTRESNSVVEECIVQLGHGGDEEDIHSGAKKFLRPQ